MTKTISIHSFRGGTGKSNLTANIAALIALKGNRVGIIDTDIQSPGIHVLFELDEQDVEYTLNDYLWGYCNVEKTAYDVSPQIIKELSLSGKEAHNLGAIYLIPSSIKAGEIAQILSEGYDVEMLKDGFDKLVERLQLDYLLIDTHPGLNEETLVSIGLSDLAIIIMRPDYQDYQGTAVTIEVAQELEVPDMFLVVNKVLDDFDFEALKAEVEAKYKTPVAGVLPLSKDIVRLASHSLFCLRFPEDPFTKEVEKIVEFIK
jgi:MinD-like ATPase involved in chromosome partitioning or flagellar assembly